jgi:hypothetical protein
LDEEKSKKCAGLAEKIVLAQYNSTLCGGRYKAQQQRCAPAEKSVINMICLLVSVFDSPIVMIGPGGLLLIVVPHLSVVPVSILWVGWQKSI